MTTTLNTAEATFLHPFDLTFHTLERVLGNICTHQIDLAELYFQNASYESWMIEDGILKSGSFETERGVGVRAISGEKTGFSFSDDLTTVALEKAANAARSIARIGGKSMTPLQEVRASHALYGAQNPILSAASTEKLALLQKIDKQARARDSQIVQVIASIATAHEVVMIMASDGTLAADVRPLIRLHVEVVAERDGYRVRGSSGGGGRYDFSELLADDKPAHFTDEAVRQALLNLDAVAAPAGTMTVVLGPGWPGVLLHEAVGHGLEGDFNRKKTSVYSDMMGKQVASPLVTVVDDGTLPGRRGSLNIDDEGTPTHYNVLIENGILKNYMQDKLNAKLMNMAPTGNGRRESYAHQPMPRMTNTYMLPGKHTPEEIIASVESGIYAANFGGGQVDITSGKFVFSANEAYRIEKGKITTPLKGITLIGSGFDVMQKITMVGNDLKLDEGIGVCGKQGQGVPVGVGQPTLRIDGLTVGGTEHD